MTKHETAAQPMSELDQIRQQGANARASGVGFFSNPFTDLGKVPAVTGEDVRSWASKVQAWWDGWEIEDTLRK